MGALEAPSVPGGGGMTAAQTNRRRPPNQREQERRRAWGIIWGGYNRRSAKQLREGQP